MKLHKFFPCLLLLVGLSLTSTASAFNEQQLIDRINRIDGVEFVKSHVHKDFKTVLELKITQPLNHNDPASKTFTQKAYLHHIDFDAPMVFNTEGYSTHLRRKGRKPITSLLKANHIAVAHRFFPGAEIEEGNWKYLTIQQAAADHHQVVTKLKSVYPSKWVNTGISKGGMTAFFHRYYYPKDVAATVSWVAPIMLDLPDPRFPKFLDTVGDATCRSRIIRFQRQALKQKDALIPLLKDYEKKKKISFKEIGRIAALEFAITEFRFYFWQYRKMDCNEIPVESPSPKVIFETLSKVFRIPELCDGDLKTYNQPVNYQTFTQLGYYKPDTRHIDDLLTTDPDFSMFFPGKAPKSFDPTLMREIKNWLENKAENMIYIYGADDPYTIAAVSQPRVKESFLIIQKGVGHHIRLEKMDEREKIVKALKRWVLN